MASVAATAGRALLGTTCINVDDGACSPHAASSARGDEPGCKDYAQQLERGQAQVPDCPGAAPTLCVVVPRMTDSLQMLGFDSYWNSNGDLAPAIVLTSNLVS